jgi:hypothetical protein
LIRFYLSFRCTVCAVFLPFFTPFSTVHFAPNFAVHFAPFYAKSRNSAPFHVAKTAKILHRTMKNKRPRLGSGSGSGKIGT